MPPWYGDAAARARPTALRRAIGLTGPAHPGLLDDLDPARAGRDQLPSLREDRRGRQRPHDELGGVPCPTRAWAQLVHPDLEPGRGVGGSWEQILHVCRLDEDDPVAAWRERVDALVGAAER